MIIPSIDLQNRRAVQLVGGEKLAIDAGDPLPIAENFALAGEIAVIDLDAAMGKGNSSDVIRGLVGKVRCRVGGGIRDYETARMWLDAGAEKIIVGTAADPEFLSKFPRERLVAALDARDGDVCVEGWQKKTGLRVEDRLKELRDYVGGFLVTFIEREGRMGGIDLRQVEELAGLAGKARLTAAGGVAAAEEIAALDAMGVDAQVGMALYSGRLGLADAIAAPLTRETPGGLWPTIVSDIRGVTLGLAWSNVESIREAVRLRRGVYFSRKRGLWLKGETSGNIQILREIRLDCDRDTVQFIVEQQGAGFCHNDTYTCFGKSSGITSLWRTILQRKADAPEGSYTRRLLTDPELLNSKIAEEARELIEAEDMAATAYEASDLLYFVLVKLAKEGIDLADVERELSMRALKVTRRGGEAKK